jgi:hypothetical protein
MGGMWVSTRQLFLPTFNRHALHCYPCDMRTRSGTLGFGSALRGRRSLRDISCASRSAPVGRKQKLVPANGRTTAAELALLPTKTARSAPSGRTAVGICLAAFVAALTCAAPARAIEVRVSSQALERTLNHQLFKTPAPTPDLPNRYYLRGKPTGGCAVFADNPQVSFAPDPNGPSRIVVKIHTHANVGASIHGKCIGVWLNIESQVSFVPYAEGESVGFENARIDKLSGSKELDALLLPFLSKKMPAEMKIDAANLMRTLLVRSPDSTGYILTLDELQLHSMQIEDQHLVVDLDAKIRVD